MLNYIFGLLIVFQVKKFAASYLLQTPYMLRKMNDSKMPMMAHALVHSSLTLIISAIVSRHLETATYLSLSAAAIDFIAQYAIDFWFSKIRSFKLDYIVLPSKLADAPHDIYTKNWTFWRWIGMKMLLHNLTIYLIIYLLVVDPYA